MGNDDKDEIGWMGRERKKVSSLGEKQHAFKAPNRMLKFLALVCFHVCSFLNPTFLLGRAN